MHARPYAHTGGECSWILGTTFSLLLLTNMKMMPPTRSNPKKTPMAMPTMAPKGMPSTSSELDTS